MEKNCCPGTSYFWAVKVWDEKGNESAFSEVATFQTGIKGAWIAKWITDSEDVDEKRAPYFRKEIKINSEVAKATVYLASAGLHELTLNGGSGRRCIYESYLYPF